MFKNYLKTGFRNLFRNKSYALINIGGLAIGIASCLLISMFVKDELTYDRQHEKFHNIFRVTTVSEIQGKTNVAQASCYPAAAAYGTEIPEVVNFTRLRKQSATVKVATDLFDEKKLLFADAGLFRIFDFELVAGSLEADFDDPSSVVITRQAAVKYLGNDDWVGQSLTLDLGQGFEDFIVKAVIENHPSNSSFNFDVAVPWTRFSTLLDAWSLAQWFITPAYSFVELQEGADLDAVVAKMKDVRWKYNPEGEPTSDFARRSVNGLLPLSEVHWNTYGNSGDIRQSYILSAIAILILIIACFNFANLTIVNSTKRSKEVGVRKTIGAGKGQLVFQFLAEALIVSTISFLLGVVLAEIALPFFEELIEKKFTRNLLTDTTLIFFSFIGVLIAAMISVIYPSLILSRLRVINVLKGVSPMKRKHFLTRFMVTFQFLLAMVFVTVTASLHEQYQFLVDKDKGYDDANLIRLSLPTDDSEAYGQRFRSLLATNADVLSTGAASDLNEMMRIKDSDGEPAFLVSGFATPGYIETLGIELLEGRDLTVDDRLMEGTQTSNVLINEQALEILGPGYGVGSTFLEGKFRIVGIIADYQLFSAKIPDRAVMLRADPKPGNNFFLNNFFIRYQSGNLPSLMASLEDSWRSIIPDKPVDYAFMDVQNEKAYKKEALWGKTLNYASSLAIIVSVMGLLGLIGLTAYQKQKEVSIRKVLGASMTNLVVLLNQGVTVLLLLSILLSVPIAYYIIDWFLQDYINRMEITAWLFIMPTLITFSLVWLAVSSITIRSARQNPVESLRYE